jgi:transposase
MSLRPQLTEQIPDETVRIARAAFPKGTLCIRLRDELGPIFQDAMFASLYSQTGQPALSPWRLALVSVLQFVEGLSDRQAADAVRSRIDWKYAVRPESRWFQHTEVIAA